jgi:hypothetical protein
MVLYVNKLFSEKTTSCRTIFHLEMFSANFFFTFEIRKVAEKAIWDSATEAESWFGLETERKLAKILMTTFPYGSPSYLFSALHTPHSFF